MTENIDKEGKAVTNKLDRGALKSLQDDAGQVFSAVGLTRGTPKVDRIKNGEPTSAYIHRSVKELHEDLPAEIAKAQAQASKWKRLAEEKRMKLQAMEQEEKLNVEKIEKTRQTLENHERREKEWVAKLDEMEKAYRSITRYVPRITAEDMPGAFGSKEKAAERINSKIDLFVRPLLIENETIRQANRKLEIEAARAKEVPKLETKVRLMQEQMAKIKDKLDSITNFVQSRSEDFAKKFWNGAEMHRKKLEQQKQDLSKAQMQQKL
jgi:predicted  nucleic acid-binding Zn-ribbon protein